jgi:hypothetical protein
MSPLVSLFYYMTLIYFSYPAISYKFVLVYMGDLFMCSSLVHHLEAPVLDELGLSIQLTSELYMFLVFVHKLEAHVHRYMAVYRSMNSPKRAARLRSPGRRGQ